MSHALPKAKPSWAKIIYQCFHNEFRFPVLAKEVHLPEQGFHSQVFIITPPDQDQGGARNNHWHVFIIHQCPDQGGAPSWARIIDIHHISFLGQGGTHSWEKCFVNFFFFLPRSLRREASIVSWTIGQHQQLLGGSHARRLLRSPVSVAAFSQPMFSAMCQTSQATRFGQLLMPVSPKRSTLFCNSEKPWKQDAATSAQMVQQQLLRRVGSKTSMAIWWTAHLDCRQKFRLVLLKFCY